VRPRQMFVPVVDPEGVSSNIPMDHIISIH
jgi:hypothetical protein